MVGLMNAWLGLCRLSLWMLPVILADYSYTVIEVKLARTKRGSHQDWRGAERELGVAMIVSRWRGLG